MDEIRVSATDEGTWRINQTETPFQELRDALQVAARLAAGTGLEEIVVVARDGSKSHVPATLPESLTKPKRRARTIDLRDKPARKVKQARR